MSDQITDVIEELNKRLEKLGLHNEVASVVGQLAKEAIDSDLDEDDPDFGSDVDMNDVDVAKAIRDGQGQFAVQGSWVLGDLAWDDRTLDPEKYDADHEFKKIMPTAREMTQDTIKNQLSEGGDIFDIDLSAFGVTDEEDDDTDSEG